MHEKYPGNILLFRHGQTYAGALTQLMPDSLVDLSMYEVGTRLQLNVFLDKYGIDRSAYGDLIGGWHNPDHAPLKLSSLTPRGVLQARNLGRWLSGQSDAYHLFSSAMPRAVHTAMLAGSSILEGSPSLVEFASHPGLRENIAREYIDDEKKIVGRGVTTFLESRPSVSAVAQESLGVLETLQLDASSMQCGFLHGGVMRAIAQVLGGTDLFAARGRDEYGFLMRLETNLSPIAAHWVVADLKWGEEFEQ